MRHLRNLLLAISLAAIVGCGGSGSPSDNSSSIRNVISTAEFLLVDPPSLSELLAVLRFITQATVNLSDDPDRFARELFEGVRDAVAGSDPVPGSNIDELFELAVDQLTRESWRLVLSDPVRGVVAAEVFEDALRSALQNYSCDAHGSHTGAKTEAFFQVLWLILIRQLSSDDFVNEFARNQSEGLTVAAGEMLRSNGRLALQLFDQFPTAIFEDFVQLLLTSPFQLISGSGAANAISYVSDKQALDGRFLGTVERRLGGDENVVLHVNRCNEDVRAQVRIVDGNGNIDAQWRLTGTANAAGDVVLQSVNRLERFFISTTTTLCGNLTLTLSNPTNVLDGQWDASSITCPLRGRLQATADP